MNITGTQATVLLAILPNTPSAPPSGPTVVQVIRRSVEALFPELENIRASSATSITAAQAALDDSRALVLTDPQLAFVGAVVLLSYVQSPAAALLDLSAAMGLKAANMISLEAFTG